MDVLRVKNVEIVEIEELRRYLNESLSKSYIYARGLGKERSYWLEVSIEWVLLDEGMDYSLDAILKPLILIDGRYIQFVIPIRLEVNA